MTRERTDTIKDKIRLQVDNATKSSIEQILQGLEYGLSQTVKSELTTAQDSIKQAANTLQKKPNWVSEILNQSKSSSEDLTESFEDMTEMLTQIDSKILSIENAVKEASKIITSNVKGQLQDIPTAVEYAVNKGNAAAMDPFQQKMRYLQESVKTVSNDVTNINTQLNDINEEIRTTRDQIETSREQIETVLLQQELILTTLKDLNKALEKQETKMIAYQKRSLFQKIFGVEIK